jgi:hypothetical protein
MYFGSEKPCDEGAQAMTVKELLQKEGVTEAEALREQAVLIALSRVSRYEAECAAFERKYGVSLAQHKACSEALRDREDFAADDDLLDWEYADSALRWWREKSAEVRDAA